MYCSHTILYTVVVSTDPMGTAATSRSRGKLQKEEKQKFEQACSYVAILYYVLQDTMSDY